MKMDNRDTGTMGGIEGLPLQLMIVILVATMGAGILIGWMNSIEAPQSIGEVTVYEDCIEVGDDGYLDDFTVTVTDQDGNLLEGATVVLDGLNVTKGGKTPHNTTGPDGKVSFSELKIDPYGSGTVGFINVLVTKTGYTESNDVKITVIL